MEKSQIVAELLKKGAKQVTNLVVQSAVVNCNGDITKGFVNLKFTAKDAVSDLDVDGKEIAVDYVNISLISIIGSLTGIVKPSVKRHIKNTPTALEDLLDGAIVAVIQQKVAKDTAYVNPFSSDPTPTVMTKDKMVSNLVDCTLSSDGKSLAKEIALFRNFGSGLFASI